MLRQAHDGAIVVLHITKANAPRTADALPSVIDGLRARGYRLVTLSDLLGALTPAERPRDRQGGPRSRYPDDPGDIQGCPRGDTSPLAPA